MSAEYHKIETLFERDEKTFVVNPDALKSPVIGTIKEWDVDEKIDGTNIRVMLAEDGTVSFNGRTDNAQLHADLIQHLHRTFTPEKMQAAFWLEGKPVAATLYGEGYGAGIQKGGGYRADKSFRMFDVRVGAWWLDRLAVRDIAAKLEIKTVPYMGRMTLEQIVSQVRNGFASLAAKEDSGQSIMSEGIVARPIEPLFDRKGARVIIKLKTKDFLPGKK